MTTFRLALIALGVCVPVACRLVFTAYVAILAWQLAHDGGPRTTWLTEYRYLTRREQS